jgi:16S rRNA (adenine1518-N6/adenine1519-N6)-dimethyltransferase
MNYAVLKKSLGQNFLINEIIAEKIASYTPSSIDTNIIEIGCGDCALTRFLSDMKFYNFHIVELDNQWAEKAQKRFTKKSIFVHNQDFLKFEFPKEKKNCITGNIPYNITYPILEKIIDNFENVESVVLMMQEEVAQKLYKKRGKEYGPISVLIQSFFNVELLDRVGPENFRPQPKVISRVIRMIPKKTNITFDIITDFKKFLGIIFKHPRKTIKNNIVNSMLKDKIDEKIASKRAQELSHEELYLLFKHIYTI